MQNDVSKKLQDDGKLGSSAETAESHEPPQRQSCVKQGNREFSLIGYPPLCISDRCQAARLLAGCEIYSVLRHDPKNVNNGAQILSRFVELPSWILYSTLVLLML